MPTQRAARLVLIQGSLVILTTLLASAHGTLVAPMSRVYRVYTSNPQNPSFPLGQSAVAIDGTLSYYTWNEVSRNVPEAVQAGLPPGFDYSPWFPDGALASAGRTDPNSTVYPRTYAGLDQVSGDWPRTPVVAGATLPVDFLVTAPHSPSVWDVWMTTPDWTPASPLNWGQMEFLGRPQVSQVGGHYLFDVQVPTNRSGPHVLWVAWQRDDAAGEVFVSTSDLFIANPSLGAAYCGPAVANSTGLPASLVATGSAAVVDNDVTLTAANLPYAQFGYFLCSRQQAQSAFPGGSQGVLCLGNPIGRFTASVLDSGPSGQFELAVDLSALPLSPPVAAAPGETWNFQAWYRDANPGATSNFTDALAVTWN